MTSLNISQREIADTKRLATIIISIEKEQNDVHYANKVTDDLYHYQPFLISTIMGYKMDLDPLVLDEVVKQYIIIWNFFKDEPNVKTTAISQDHYKHVEYIWVMKLQKFGNLKSEYLPQESIKKDLNKSPSKVLIAAIYI